MVGVLSLPIWTVTQSPSDFPGKFVARESRVASTGERWVSLEPIVEVSLEAIRRQMRAKGLARIPRHERDDEVIVECWL